MADNDVKKAEKQAAKFQQERGKQVEGDLRPSTLETPSTPAAVPVDSVKRNTSPNQTVHTPPKKG